MQIQEIEVEENDFLNFTIDCNSTLLDIIVELILYDKLKKMDNDIQGGE
jgi:hypothetical protein